MGNNDSGDCLCTMNIAELFFLLQSWKANSISWPLETEKRGKSQAGAHGFPQATVYLQSKSPLYNSILNTDRSMPTVKLNGRWDTMIFQKVQTRNTGLDEEYRSFFYPYMF